MPDQRKTKSDIGVYIAGERDGWTRATMLRGIGVYVAGDESHGASPACDEKRLAFVNIAGNGDG